MCKQEIYMFPRHKPTQFADDGCTRVSTVPTLQFHAAAHKYTVHNRISEAKFKFSPAETYHCIMADATQAMLQAKVAQLAGTKAGSADLCAQYVKVG